VISRVAGHAGEARTEINHGLTGSHSTADPARLRHRLDGAVN
jgi:hypothetical protein